MFMFKKTLAMPSATEVLPCPQQTDPDCAKTSSFIGPATRALSARPGERDVRDGLLLGRRDVNFGELEQGIHIPRRVGYAAGLTPHSIYTRRSAPGRTGHNEVVLVVYDPSGYLLPGACSKTFLGEP